MSSGHIVLLGDSVFDNAAYTCGGPDVVTHLRAILPAGWETSLRAVDGATTLTMAPQLERVPPGATHLVVSIGGNDALGNLDLLSTRVQSTTEALTLFGSRVAAFESNYSRAVGAALKRDIPVTLCTIYNGNLERGQAALARVALMLFNDAIVRTAFAHRTALIDLRTVCAAPEDYANPIEPSDLGGRKIAYAVAHAVGALEGPSPTRAFID